MKRKSKTVCIICSSGGHLRQAMELIPALEGNDRFWISFDKEDACELLKGEKVFWAFHPTQRNIGNFLRNLALAFYILLRKRGDVLISTGAGVAVPFFIIGKLMGKKLVFIESFSRINKPSLTGRMVYRFSDHFFIQWENLKKYYPSAEYRGKLL